MKLTNLQVRHLALYVSLLMKMYKCEDFVIDIDENIQDDHPNAAMKIYIPKGYKNAMLTVYPGFMNNYKEGADRAWFGTYCLAHEVWHMVTHKLLLQMEGGHVSDYLPVGVENIVIEHARRASESLCDHLAKVMMPHIKNNIGLFDFNNSEEYMSKWESAKKEKKENEKMNTTTVKKPVTTKGGNKGGNSGGKGTKKASK